MGLNEAGESSANSGSGSADDPSAVAVAQALNPSLSALILQVQAVLRNLDRFTSRQYPVETMRLVGILIVLARRVQECVEDAAFPIAQQMSEFQVARYRVLAKITQKLNSYIRFFQASDPFISPPAIQQAISSLVAQVAPASLKANSDDVVVLVRPQWTYNLKFIDLLELLQKFYADLDISGETKAVDIRSLLTVLWERNKLGSEYGTKVPRFASVLSFAGLDREDVLLYPLLAHEIGHFLDLSQEVPIYQDPSVRMAAAIPTVAEIEDIVREFGASQTATELCEKVTEKIGVCLREITADLLAARMMGIGYFFALAEFFETILGWPGSTVDFATGYPGFAYRMWLVWSEITDPAGGMSVDESISVLLSEGSLPGSNVIREYLRVWKLRLSEPPLSQSKPASLREALQQRVVNATRAVPEIRKLVRKLIPPESAARIPADLADMVSLLQRRCPPYQHSKRSERLRSGYAGHSFVEVLTAGWFYEIGVGEAKEANLPASSAREAEYNSTCALLFKAIELSHAPGAIKEIVERNNRTPNVCKPPSTQTFARAGTASGLALRDSLDTDEMQARLIVSPDLGDDPIEAASWDLHLGNWFRMAQRTAVSKFDIAYRTEQSLIRKEGQTESYVRFGNAFVLHPGDFALASSLEYVCFPNCLMAFVEGKSSLGRGGLLIATATQIAPGFRGCVVLELYNAGTVPILLRPGMQIAQLVFVHLDCDLQADWLYDGGFQVQVRP